MIPHQLFAAMSVDSANNPLPATMRLTSPEFVESGKKVLLPFDHGSRYDLALDEKGRLVRVQVKAGWLDQGGAVIRFNACSNNKGYRRRMYEGEIDCFAVFCQENKTTYLVPVEDVHALEGRLRLTPTGNSQKKKIKWAKDYEIK